MKEPLDASLVRIRTSDGRVVGAGFLVGEQQNPHLCPRREPSTRPGALLLSMRRKASLRSIFLSFPRACFTLPASSFGVLLFPMAGVILPG